MSEHHDPVDRALNAMKSNVAANILREFESDPDVELATDLLENLRTFGLKAALKEGSADAGNAANPSNAGPEA